MTEKEFKKILFTHLEEYTEFNKKLDELEKFLGIEIYDNVLFETYYKAFDRVNSLLFNEEGLDWLEWYVFDKEEDCTTLTYNCCEINIDTFDKFFNFIKRFANVKFEDSHNKGC